jgi:uncharacterized repeat protein (TIGR03803 family)
MRRASVLRSCLPFAVVLGLFQSALAQNETVLHNFCVHGGSCPDGANLFSSLTPDGGGNFYGTALIGGDVNGDGGGGTVFELSPNGLGGYNETTLYTFYSLPYGADGFEPFSNVIFDSQGNLYGTTYFGGAYASSENGGYGIVFELSPETGGSCPSGSNPGSGWCETVLYSFKGQPDGESPEAGLTFDHEGNLYGTTLRGGGNGYLGTAYELSPNGSGGWNEQVIYNYGGVGGLAIDGSGNLYGASSSNDTVFELSPNGSGGWNPAILHDFGAAKDGTGPTGTPVLDSDGNIYGTTTFGGSRDAGTVWKLTLATKGKTKGTYKEKILHSFTSEKNGYCAAGRDGSCPFAGVVLDSSGNIYGTTVTGGGSGCGFDGYGIVGSGCGTVFELAVSGTAYKEKILWSFNGADGANPMGGLIVNGGNLYGTTTYGGASFDGGADPGAGVAFEITP